MLSIYTLANGATQDCGLAQKRALPLSYNITARLDLVYFGFQQPSRKMACDLAPNCSFVFCYFSCNLPEDMIEVDIIMCTLWGIHTFRKDRNTQISKCSPWGMEVRPFPALGKKMRDYMEVRQAIANSFSSNRSDPSRPNPSPLVKWPKATPAKKRTKGNIENLLKPIKVNAGYYLPAFQ